MSTAETLSMHWQASLIAEHDVWRVQILPLRKLSSAWHPCHGARASLTATPQPAEAHQRHRHDELERALLT